MQPLQSLVTKLQATSIANHVFTPSAPNEIAPPSSMSYLFSNSGLTELYEHSREMQDVTWDWVMRADKEKVLKPIGVVLHTRKQLVMPYEGRSLLKRGCAIVLAAPELS